MDRWFWILKNMSKADKIPAFMNKRVFQRIFKVAEVSNLNEKERMAYEASLQDKWIWDSAMSLAKKKAAKEAAEKATKEAAEKERINAEKKSHEIVANLIEQTAFDDAKIASLAMVAVSFVQKIRAELTKAKK